MHSIKITEEGLNHLPENFISLSQVDGNKYFYYDKHQQSLKIGYEWDNILKEDNLGDDFKDIFKGKQPVHSKYVKNTIIKVLKFVKPFEFAIWHNEDSYCDEFEYFKYDGKKFYYVSRNIEYLEMFHPDYDKDYDIHADERNEDFYVPFTNLLQCGEQTWNLSREELLNHEYYEKYELIDPQYFLNGMKSCLEGKERFFESYVYDLNGIELASYNVPK